MMSVNLSDDKSLPDRLWCVKMSSNGFFVSEQKPLLGRGLTEGDERPGAPAVVELTYHVWEDRYGRDPKILGRSIRVNDVPTIVIGVMPAGKRFPEDTDLWTPLTPDAQLERRSERSVTPFGRLGSGVTMAAAQSELSTIIPPSLPNNIREQTKDLTAKVETIAAVLTGVYHARPLFVAL